LYLVVISRVHSFRTGENTPGEKQVKSGEIPKKFSNSLAETVKNIKIKFPEEDLSSKK